MYDFYDDPDGTILQTKLHSDQLNELLKHGHILSEDEIQGLPDRLFSVVILNNDSQLRKYARCDLPNTMISAIYFLENWRNLPAPAVKIAAANLLEACEWYDLEIPPQLRKLAINPLTFGFAAMAGKDIAAQGKQRKERLLSALGVPNPEAKFQSPKLASTDLYVEVDSTTPTAGDWIDWDLAGVSGSSLKLASLQDFQRSVQTYIDDHWKWAPEQKVAFCRPLLKWATEVGLQSELPLDIRQYGNTKESEAEYITTMLGAREECFANPQDYVDYLTKAAEAAEGCVGDELAAKLASVDRQFYLDQYWDESIPDPWRAVYGVIKLAEGDEYVFAEGEVRITGPELRRLAGHGRNELLKVFDEEMVNAFQSSPIAIFESLPLDHKRVIVRIEKELNQKSRR